MSIRGIIAIGLLDSPSEVLTLGLDAAITPPPDGPGHKTIAAVRKGRAIADIEKPRTKAAIVKARTIAEWDS